MGSENRGYRPPEAGKKNSEKYRAEALEMAQRISQRWNELKGTDLTDEQDLDRIYNMTRPPKSGIQVWFDGKIQLIEQQAGDENAKSRMTYRLKEELQKIESSVDRVLRKTPK